MSIPPLTGAAYLRWYHIPVPPVDFNIDKANLQMACARAVLLQDCRTIMRSKHAFMLADDPEVLDFYEHYIGTKNFTRLSPNTAYINKGLMRSLSEGSYNLHGKIKDHANFYSRLM